MGLSGFSGIAWLAAGVIATVSWPSWDVLAQYAFLLRVPLALAALLILLPLMGLRFAWSKPLVRGLFDLQPDQALVVALAAVAAAGAAAMNASIVLAYAPARMGVRSLSALPAWAWVTLVGVLSLWIVGAVVLMTKQQDGPVWPCLGKGLLGWGLGMAVAAALVFRFEKDTEIQACDWVLFGTVNLGPGYVNPAGEFQAGHVQAGVAFVCILVVYACLGLYGWHRLKADGKTTAMVPALASALMLAVMLCWICAPLAFLFDVSRFPFLLVLAAWGAITGQSLKSDHFYRLVVPAGTAPKPEPAKVVGDTERIIVVAANGGGIQSAAWAAQVLHGLAADCKQFKGAVKMISAVSGGSLGTVFYVDWLRRSHAKQAVPDPVETAMESSLDEVAWGIAWTDFLRGLVPWLFGSFGQKPRHPGWVGGGLIGRGRLLEEAWSYNAEAPGNKGQKKLKDQALSDWRPEADTAHPAIILNATATETGKRVLFSTSSMGAAPITGRARVDADQIHEICHVQYDVAVSTAARLSASFPYVTPAARSDAAGDQPHIVDGGYYDNYGMATLVEWLDSALQRPPQPPDAVKEPAKKRSVLVIQILGSPVAPTGQEKAKYTSRGWFFQAFAPVTTLLNVRSSGQFAHNEIELDLLKQKWASEVSIESVQFEFPDEDAPLSWHLTPNEKAAIGAAWNGNHCKQKDSKIWDARDTVCRYLSCPPPRRAPAPAGVQTTGEPV
ncbi:MAG: patatin-like phospholipase family protein [Acidobacteria bacterium]|nr:patatin-like phospholipase family protein [Acidobacteriota bacterium]